MIGRCYKHAPSIAPSICPEQCSGTFQAMHVRTDGRTYGESTHLDDEISPLATRAGAYENRDFESAAGGKS